jgi:predicted HTH transcriptional regulator
MQIELGCESQTLDYKAELFLTTRDERAAIAKDIIAMSNSGGGRIIAGVAEIRPGIFEPRGLSEERAAALEVSRLNRAVAPYIDPSLAISSRRVEHKGMTFVCLDIPDSSGELVMAARQNAAAGLLPGRIYIRTTAAESAEVQSSLEARNLIERLITFRQRTGRR